MKVAFDAQPVVKVKKTGIGWCTEQLIENLKQDKSISCIMRYFHFKQTDGYVNMKEYEGVILDECGWFSYRFYKILWPFFRLPYSLFFRSQADVSIFTNFFIPYGVKGKKINIVHDMAYLTYPETVKTDIRLWLHLVLKGSCKRADKIIAVSEFTKKEIIKYLKIDKDKIVVIPNGVDFSKYRNKFSNKEVVEMRKRYNINEKYFLYLGTLEPRKNIIMLLKGYKLLLDKYGNEIPKLVIAGGKGWFYQSIFEFVENNNMQKNVHFTGYVDERDVAKLMYDAQIFLFPSLYEGFGMPPLEAMACGTPVIVSNAASLPEVVGDAGILVDPYSETELFKAIEDLWLNPQKLAELSKKGMERAKKFSWERSSALLKNVCESLIE